MANYIVNLIVDGDEQHVLITSCDDPICAQHEAVSQFNPSIIVDSVVECDEDGNPNYDQLS